MTFIIRIYQDYTHLYSKDSEPLWETTTEHKILLGEIVRVDSLDFEAKVVEGVNYPERGLSISNAILILPTEV